MTKERKKLRKLTSVIITSHDLIIKMFSLYGAMWIIFLMDLFYLLALTSSSKPISIKELGAFEVKQTRSDSLVRICSTC